MTLINEKILKHDGLIGNVVWTNLNSTSTFGEQTININLSNYSKCEIVYTYSIDNKIYEISTGKLDIGTSHKELTHEWLSGLGECLIFRNANIQNSSVNFANCYPVKLSDGSITTTANDFLIPFKIIGYK